MQFPWQAALVQMDRRQREGELLVAAEVKERIFTLCRLTRDRILTIPNRIAPKLVGLEDQRQISRKIRNEIEAVLLNLVFDRDEAKGDSTTAL